MASMPAPTNDTAAGRTRRRSWLPGALIALALLAFFVVYGLLWSKFGEVTRPVANVRPVTFEIRLAETAPREGLTEATVWTDPNRRIYLHAEPLVTNADLVSAKVLDDQEHVALEFAVNDLGAARLRQATAAHSGQPMAILVDGEVRMAPTVHSQIGGKGVIQGGFSVIEAERIAAGMMAR